MSKVSNKELIWAMQDDILSWEERGEHYLELKKSEVELSIPKDQKPKKGDTLMHKCLLFTIVKVKELKDGDTLVRWSMTSHFLEGYLGYEPIVKGGQGRSDQHTKDVALIAVWCGIAFVILFALLVSL